MKYEQNEKAILAENRKFQLERIGLFSDAVFAIAITLLIIELKIPENESETAATFLQSFLNITHSCFGFLFSFIFIGMYWVMHHKIFFHVKDFTDKLIWLNIMMLLSIVIMPFSTAVAFEHMTSPDYPFVIYALNHIFVGICLYSLWNYIGKTNSISVGINSRFLKYKKTRSLCVIFVFTFTVIASFFNPLIARFSPILIAPIFILVKRKFRDVSSIEF